MLRLPLLSLLALVLSVPVLAQIPSEAPGASARRALLVGVADYAPGEARRIPDLSGPVNDVPLMREVLIERGFAKEDILELTNEAATRDGILETLDAWIDAAHTGDDLVFYFSGHGSQAPGDASERDGMYETIVPYDAGLGASDIVDKELRQRWNRALDVVGPSGSLTVIQDNCHSGSGSRDPLAWTPRQADPATNVTPPDGDVGPPPHERGALLLSASQDREVAIERPIDGVMHGGFTISLARALRATPPGAPASLVFEKTLAHVRSLQLRQEGVIEGLETDPSKPLFGEDPAPGGGFGVGVVEVDGDRVVLRGGPFMGLDTGAELVRFLAEAGSGTEVRLRVDTTEAAVRSIATVTDGDAESVRVGDLFRITRPVPMRETHPLRLWLPPAVATAADALAAADSPCECAASCSDAPVEAPRALVLPTADGWHTVSAADEGSGVAYRPLPPTAALHDALSSSLASSELIHLISDPAEADYWLVGERVDGAVRYRWVQRATATSGDELQSFPQFSSTVPGDASGATTLSNAARSLAKIKAWLTVPSPETASFPVQALGLRRRSDGIVLRPDSTGILTIPASSGLCSADPAGCYTLALGVRDADLNTYNAAPSWMRWDARYGYAFIIDPAGESCLFFPYNRCNREGGQVENVLDLSRPETLSRVPTTDADSVHVFDLGSVSPPLAFKSGPFGRHTLVLVTTTERLPKPGAAFNWPAVTTSFRTEVEEPDSWSVHRLTFDVLPGAPPPTVRAANR